MGKAARHALTAAEQDCAEPELDERRRERRGLTLFTRADGTARVSGELDAQLTETLLAVLDATAAPPSGDGMRDPRTAGQPRHDGLLDALLTLLRSGQVPDVGSVTTTVLITISEQAWRTGRGHAVTGHGGVITAREALRWTGGDTAVLAAAIDDMGTATALSGEHRIFTKRQRRAMTARDKGCTFPGCDAPPGWTEAHHVTDYQLTGRTCVSDGALACSYHHREAIRRGWTTVMSNG